MFPVPSIVEVSCPTPSGAVCMENRPTLTIDCLGVAVRRTKSTGHSLKRRTFTYGVLSVLSSPTSRHRATATTAVDVALNVLGGVREGTGPVETLRKSPPSVLRKLCEKMGATYIKVRLAVFFLPTFVSVVCPTGPHPPLRLGT